MEPGMEKAWGGLLTVPHSIWFWGWVAFFYLFFCLKRENMGKNLHKRNS